MSRLFREEVVQNCLSSIGIPLGIIRGWMRVYTSLLAMAIFFGVLAVIFTSYTRKSQTTGFLVPDKGLIKVLSSRSGRVFDLRIKEGKHVHKDDILVVIDVGTVSEVGRTGELITKSLKERRNLLGKEQARLDIIQTSERNRLDAVIVSLKEQIVEEEEQIRNQQQSVALARNSFIRSQSLANMTIYSISQKEKAEQDMLNANARLIELKRELAVNRGDLAQNQAVRQGLDSKQDNDRSQLERSVSEIDQQLLQVSENRSLILCASDSGTVTGVTVNVGSAVDAATPLMTIIPDESHLEANLYVPSRAVGFVKNHTEVLLRYEAYPYQKFGAQKAEVISISRTAVSSKELPFPVSSDEPLYLITARPEKNTITTFGHEEPLRAGEKFKADLLLEQRKLWEWALEPLLAMKGGF